MFTVVKSVKFNICKSSFLLNLYNKADLPQYKNFCDITNNNQTNYLIVNDGYCSLDELKEKIITASKTAKNYFYIAVNKFYIYSNNDISTTSENYDVLLINYCYNLVKHQFKLIDTTIRNDDRGQLGNFVHPVTTLLLKRYGKI